MINLIITVDQFFSSLTANHFQHLPPRLTRLTSTFNLTLKMSSALVVQTSVTISSLQNYNHPDNHKYSGTSIIRSPTAKKEIWPKMTD